MEKFESAVVSGYSKFGRRNASAKKVGVGNFLFTLFAYERTLTGYAFERINVHSPSHL